MLQAFRKRRAIRSYRTQLGPYLEKHYGKQKHYTPAQVKAGAQQLGLATDPLCYGFAMYCDRADFVTYHQSIGQHCDYDAMQSELAVGGGSNLGDFFSSHEGVACDHHGGHGASGFDGGGFDGGDGDGGGGD
jgi:hypothetical protein